MGLLAVEDLSARSPSNACIVYLYAQGLLIPLLNQCVGFIFAFDMRQLLYYSTNYSGYAVVVMFRDVPQCINGFVFANLSVNQWKRDHSHQYISERL